MYSISKQTYLVLLFFLVLAWVVTYPTILYPLYMVPGDFRSDVWDHLWGYWRTERSLFTDHQFPYAESHMNYPKGGVLYHVDLLNSFFMLPLRAIFGMTAAYNILVWGHLVGAAFAMYLLAKRFVAHTLPAIFAGVSFAFSPFMLSLTLGSGVANRLNIVWIPLFFLFYCKLLDNENKSIFNILLAATMFFFSLIGCWLYGQYVFMLCVFFSVFLLLRPLFSKPEETRRTHYIALIFKKMFPLAIACALAGVPIGWLASQSVSEDASSIYQREHHMFWDGTQPLEDMSTFGLVDFFVPNERALLITNTFDMLFQTTYLGYVMLVFGFASLVSKRKYSFFFFPTALVFAGLALGPYIMWYRGGELIPSPIYRTLARIIPYMTTHESPWEFVLPVFFCASVAAAMGIDWFLSLVQRSQIRERIGIACIALLIVENFIFSPSQVPVRTTQTKIPQYYYEIAKQTDDFAIFDFPTRRPFTMLLPTEYFYFQTVHHKPIPYAVQNSWLDTHQFWVELTRRQQRGSTMSVMDEFGICRAGMAFGCGTADKIRKQLARDNFRYFILHTNLILEQEQQDYREFFDSMFGTAEYTAEDLVVYRIVSQK